MQSSMPGSLFPRSPSPAEQISMKHVHFTPPAQKKKPITEQKAKPRPVEVPLPRSRSNSPPPVEKSIRRERRNSVSQIINHINHHIQDTPLVLTNGNVSE